MSSRPSTNGETSLRLYHDNDRSARIISVKEFGTFHEVRNTIAQADWFQGKKVEDYQFQVHLLDWMLVKEFENLEINFRRTEEAVDFSDMVQLFLRSFFGWSPPLWISIHSLKQPEGYLLTCEEWMKRYLRVVFVWSIFVVDLLDAIVDIALGIHAELNGTEGDPSFGILTIVMTILGRCLAGYYGLVYKESTKIQKVLNGGELNEDEKKRMFAIYILVEISIFMIEDGASIMLLASNPEQELLYEISSWLSVLSAITMMFYVVQSQPEVWNDCGPLCICCGPMMLVLWGLIFSPVLFMIVILFREVILKDSIYGEGEDNNFSGGWRTATISVYAIGSLFAFACSLNLIHMQYRDFIRHHKKVTIVP